MYALVIAISVLAIVFIAAVLWGAHVDRTITTKVIDTRGTNCVFEVDGHREINVYGYCLYKTGETATFEHLGFGDWRVK